MRKMTLMRVTELRKDSEGKTKCLLGPDGYVSAEGIRRTSGYNEGGGFCIECDDAEAPELGQHLIIMVETLPASLGTKRVVSDAAGDPFKDYLEKRRAEVASPQAEKPGLPGFPNGRKFR